MEWCRKTTLDFPKAIDKEKMDRITPNIPKYIEVKHQDRVDEARNNFLMMQTIKISIEGGWTCPAKTIAIFAHNTEFSFEQEKMPRLVETVSHAKTIQDVSQLVKNGDIPAAISGQGKQIDLEAKIDSKMMLGTHGCQIVLFDTKQKEVNQEPRLVSWVSFYRHKYARSAPLEICLPRAVTTKFVTAVFIESENYLEGIELQMHPLPNVDC